MTKKTLAFLLVFVAIIVDQALKIYVKTHFYLGEEVQVFDWFRIHFTENNGMAMGFEFGGKIGKLFLTLFRIVAVSAIIYWLFQTIKKEASKGVVIAISLVLAGAIGNIIDSVFYGVVFNASSYNEQTVATLFSDQPYGSLFFGKVVDMFYFPLWQGVLPDWIPFVGGEFFTFFQYIFNPADAYISVGVFLLFLFNKQAFPKEEND